MFHILQVELQHPHVEYPEWRVGAKGFPARQQQVKKLLYKVKQGKWTSLASRLDSATTVQGETRQVVQPREHAGGCLKY